MPWFPVAAPEDPTRRIDQGDKAITADDLREAAESYDRSWRASSLISGYDLETGESGNAHFVGRVRPEVAPILAYRFNEASQELEAEIDRLDRVERLFALGFRKPSINLVRFPDHPSGPRLYIQHVALAGPGETEVIAGLGGERWEERFRAFQDGARTAFPDSRQQQFRSLTDQEISAMKEETSGKPEEAKPETKPEEAERNRAADTSTFLGRLAKDLSRLRAGGTDKPEEAKPDENTEKPEEKPKLRAVEDDPQTEMRQQIADLTGTMTELAATVGAFVATAGDPERIRALTVKAEQLVKDGVSRAAADRESRITREVEALASGDEPRLRTAEVDDEVEALLALDPDKAEARLTRLRAREPVARNLGEEFLTGQLVEDLPTDFELARFRTNDDRLPGPDQIRDIAILSNEGKGDPVAAQVARERTANLRRT